MLSTFGKAIKPVGKQLFSVSKFKPLPDPVRQCGYLFAGDLALHIDRSNCAMKYQTIGGGSIDSTKSLSWNFSQNPSLQKWSGTLYDGYDPWKDDQAKRTHETSIYFPRSAFQLEEIGIVDGHGIEEFSVVGSKIVLQAKGHVFYDENLDACLFHSEGTQDFWEEGGLTMGQLPEVWQKGTGFKEFKPAAQALGLGDDAKLYHKGREINLSDAGDVTRGVFNMSRLGVKDQPHLNVGKQVRTGIGALPDGKPLIIVLHSLGGNLGELALLEALAAKGKFSSIHVIRYGSIPTVHPNLSAAYEKLGVNNISIYNPSDPLLQYFDLLFGSDGGPYGLMSVVPGVNYVNIGCPSVTNLNTFWNIWTREHGLRYYQAIFQQDAGSKFVPMTQRLAYERGPLKEIRAQSVREFLLGKENDKLELRKMLSGLDFAAALRQENK